MFYEVDLVVFTQKCHEVNIFVPSHVQCGGSLNGFPKFFQWVQCMKHIIAGGSVIQHSRKHKKRKEEEKLFFLQPLLRRRRYSLDTKHTNQHPDRVKWTQPQPRNRSRACLPAYLPGVPPHRRAASGPAKWEWSLLALSGKPGGPHRRPWAHCQTHKLSPEGSRDPCLKKAHKVKPQSS